MALASETAKAEWGQTRFPVRKWGQALGRGCVLGLQALWATCKRCLLFCRLQPPSLRHSAAAALDQALRRLDAFLRYCQAIEEFNHDERCLLRISLREADRDLVLQQNGTVYSGDLVGELHLWNEHIIPPPSGGPDLAWAVAMRRRTMQSLAQLAVHIQRDPRFAQVGAFRAETALGTGRSREQIEHVARGLGFELTDGIRATGLVGRMVGFGESIYLWGMMRAFNPSSLKKGQFVRPCWYEFWISRERLLCKYAHPRGKGFDQA